MANGHGGKRAGAGRKHGARNSRSEGVETFARRIVEDPEVQAMILLQAKNGVLPAPLMSMLFAYSYGKPVERVELSGDEDKPVQVVIRRAH